MIITRLYIQNFRNINLLNIRPASGFNIVYGINGSGKTSFLEALSYLSLGRSFRGASYHHLISATAQGFVLSCDVYDERREHLDTLGVSRTRSRSEDLQISINSCRGSRLIDLVDHICVQIVHPDGISLVLGSPELRRGFLDWGVFYSRPEFHSLWLKYRKVLSQRNYILRSGMNLDSLHVWDTLLAGLSEEITRLRAAYLEDLRSVLAEKISAFLPGFKLSFELAKGWDKNADLRSVLSLNLEKDRNLGYTYYGCHRADLKIRTSKASASDTLSRGQLKLLVCAMRLSQAFLLQQQTGRSCIFLIDDLNSELDSNSRNILLTELLKSSNQVFITNITKDINLPDRDNCFCLDIIKYTGSSV